MSEELEDARRREWLRTVIKWDGCLPLIAATSRIALIRMIPSRDVADITAVFLVPFATAIARAHRGSRQLAQVADGRGIGRQLLLACAILMLMLFEVYSGLMLCLGMAIEGCVIAATLYVVYLYVMIAAVRPPRPSRPAWRPDRLD